ncbi:hypothetical protein [Segnochrobactrum spirostomi]|nr:hypothetical protein [Segnochrobactrum spirostomi]
MPLAATPAQATEKPVYTAIVDAGSSGTSIALYEVVPGPYPKITALASDEGDDAEDGIDDFVNRVGGPKRDLGPDAVGDAVFRRLLDALTPTLAARGIAKSDVVVDVLATAGMRGTLKPVGTHDQTEIDAFYAGIRAYIEKQGFKAGEARTIDGNSEEGLWSWIDLNDHYRRAFTGGEAPVGVVEVGGSSMQVSYPTTAAPDPAQNVYRVAINGSSYAVFNRTYIGLGQDDARKAMRLESPPADGGARCFPTGLEPAQDAGDLIKGELVRIAHTATFDAAACEASYSTIVEKRFAAVGAPAVNNSTGAFYGIASVRYAFEEIGVPPAKPSEGALSKAIEAKCVGAGAVANFKIAKKYAQRACANAAYVDALLYGRAGLFHETPERFVTTVADQHREGGRTTILVSWSRGYLLQKYAR